MGHLRVDFFCDSDYVHTYAEVRTAQFEYYEEFLKPRNVLDKILFPG